MDLLILRQAPRQAQEVEGVVVDGGQDLPLWNPRGVIDAVPPQVHDDSDFAAPIFLVLHDASPAGLG